MDRDTREHIAQALDCFVSQYATAVQAALKAAQRASALIADHPDPGAKVLAAKRELDEVLASIAPAPEDAQERGDPPEPCPYCGALPIDQTRS